MWNRDKIKDKAKVEINFIRHSITSANEQHLYFGQTDIGLSDKGIKKINSLKQLNIYPKGDIYICSPMVRCKETMELIYEQTNYICIDELKEINFGKFELKSYEQLKNNKEYKQWISNIEKNTIPMGENVPEFKKRTHLGLEKILDILKNHPEPNIKVVVVTHGGVIASIMDKLFPQENNFYDWQPQCGRGYKVTLTENIKYKEI